MIFDILEPVSMCALQKFRSTLGLFNLFFYFRHQQKESTNVILLDKQKIWRLAAVFCTPYRRRQVGLRSHAETTATYRWNY